MREERLHGSTGNAFSAKAKAKMHTPLRILHLEDDPRDAELVRMMLKNNGIVAEIDRVETREEFEAALKAGQYDLIISDYTLPKFDGQTGLAIAKQLAPETPFIFLSGTMGEDAAITSLRNGATDYVLKHRLERFVPAVERTLRELEERNTLKLAEQQVRAGEELFRLIAENATDLIAVLDLDGRRLYNSPSYASILGDPAALRGTDSFREIHPDDRERIREAFRRTVETGIGERAEYRFIGSGGKVWTIESQGNLVRDAEGKPEKVVVVSRDITERKMLEEELRQSQKMESLGTLAAGIAHDFNNILGIIMGHFSLIRKKIGERSDLQANADAIMTAVDRGSDLVRQIMTYARNTSASFETLTADEVIHELISLLKGTFPKTVTFDLELEQPPTTISADRTQLHQALLNLCVNARDAMPSGGRITIGTQRVRSETISGRPAGTPGRWYLRIRVSDTGTGIDDITLPHIFEPFFTTKGRESGTGLGLSVVYGIVKAHEGSIDVKSQLGVGTTFSIDLPLSEAASVPPSAVADESPNPVGGTHTILLVEDEQPMRELLGEIFEGAGYRVLTARDGLEAVRMFQARAAEISAVVSDYGLPGLDGMGMFLKMRQVKRHVLVLFTSGFLHPDLMHELYALGVADIIQKPFDPNAVLQKVDELVGRERENR